MGFLDDLKGKAEEFGEKAKEGFEAAKDRASDLIGDANDELDAEELLRQPGRQVLIPPDRGSSA